MDNSERTKIRSVFYIDDYNREEGALTVLNYEVKVHMNQRFWMYLRGTKLMQWLKHRLMSHRVIWSFILKGKHPPIELQSQNGLVYLGIYLNSEKGQ